jgi:DNA-binding transcriptional LysR family regulator
MITKQVVVDQITVTENGIVLYREATRIIEDGNVLTKTYHRTSLTPGQDLTGQPDKVVAIAQAAWTPEVIAAFQAAQEANRPAPTATPEPTSTPTQEPAAP